MKYTYALFLILITFLCKAQTDSIAYNAQRVKINSLLAQRSEKFGNYYESLNQKTGIFGWQTKKDIKNSNEILREIVLNDNNIFDELKVLMDYKDLENNKKNIVADDSKERIENYMRTIKKLQDQNELLKNQLTQKQSNNSSYLIFLFILIIAILSFIIFKLRKNNALATRNT